jgi:hypothetical protein
MVGSGELGLAIAGVLDRALAALELGTELERAVVALGPLELGTELSPGRVALELAAAVLAATAVGVHPFGNAGSAAAGAAPPGTPIARPAATTGSVSAATSPAPAFARAIADPSRHFDTRRSVAEWRGYWIGCRM